MDARVKSDDRLRITGPEGTEFELIHDGHDVAIWKPGQSECIIPLRDLDGFMALIQKVQTLAEDHL